MPMLISLEAVHTHTHTHRYYILEEYLTKNGKDIFVAKKKDVP